MNVEESGLSGRGRPRVRPHWAAHVLAQASSGLRVVDYCRRHGLSRESFYRWKRLLRESGEFGALLDGVGPKPGASAGREAKPLFAEMRLPEGAALPEASGVEVALQRGAVVRVARGFDSETLRRVVSALEGGAC